MAPSTAALPSVVNPKSVIATHPPGRVAKAESQTEITDPEKYGAGLPFTQFRLVLHTAAYWLMLALRDAVPRRMPLHWAEFATLRQKLLKNLPRTRSGGGARVIERAARIRIHFASACPDAALFRMLAGRLAASGP